PNAGFTAWNQRAEDQIQVEMNCRPCSVFGNKPCFRNDYACLHRIEPTHIVKRIETCLNEKK
ncbi:MAG: glycosyl transferase family 1, partial [Bacteroidales bacterium]|nr:glycosyl transferase family 1 [Bacteroidales bacterium]